MPRLDVTFEVVTPLFLGGSDPRGEPELRAPSMRGALRYWLRALLGGVLGDRPDKVSQHESQIFGSTDHASPVILRVESRSLESDGFNPLPHRQAHAGRQFAFRGFKPGQRFDARLFSRDELALQQAKKALWLLCHLGGLGRRSRRGFGSLQITEGELALTAKESTELADVLKKRLNLVLPPSSAELQNAPSFPILHPTWAQVRVCTQEFSDWQDAIHFIMENAHKHKNPALGSANPRQASPVHVHVSKLSTGKYALVLTTMLSQLNPQLGGIADRQKLVEFLNSFAGEAIFGFKEVPEGWMGGSGR